MAIGAIYLLYLTVSLFVQSIHQPVAVIFAQAIVWGGALPEELGEDELEILTVIFKITAFVCAISFLLLGTYIAYYKSVVKVDAMKQVL